MLNLHDKFMKGRVHQKFYLVCRTLFQDSTLFKELKLMCFDS
jgi:hypothetical protein